jgi:hypothetical protein
MAGLSDTVGVHGQFDPLAIRPYPIRVPYSSASRLRKLRQELFVSLFMVEGRPFIEHLVKMCNCKKSITP